MNLEYLHNYVKVVECGTISAAAKQLLIAQPALSNQMKTLEQIYNCQLFVRNPRYLSLTDAGKILYDKAKIIISTETIAKKEIEDCSSGKRGTLWFGISASFPDPQISNLLLNFSSEYPNITFELYETNGDELVKLLKNEIIELAIFRTRENVYPLIESAVTISEPLMAVYRRDSRWLPNDIEKIPLASLEKIPLSLSKGLRSIVENSCAAAGFSPVFKAVTASRFSSLIWTQRDQAVAIVPVHNISDYETSEYCCRPFDGYNMYINKSVNYLKGHYFSTTARLFLKFCEANFCDYL